METDTDDNEREMEKRWERGVKFNITNKIYNLEVIIRVETKENSSNCFTK
jgi:hypothetical protein